MAMTSSVSYLLRGLHEWILDNSCTPYLVLDPTIDGTIVPEAVSYTHLPLPTSDLV